MNTLNNNQTVESTDTNVVEVKKSKQTIAIEFVRSIMIEDQFPARKMLMDHFKANLQMSDAGASTYVANLKKMFNTNSFPTVRVKSEKVKSEKVKKAVDKIIEVEVEDSRPTFSKCFCVDDLIVEIASSFDKTEARKLQPSEENVNKYGKLSEILIEGIPETYSRKEVKEKFTLIRIK